MKGKDYGGNNALSKEKLNGSISTQEIEEELELINKNLINTPYTLKNKEESKIQKNYHIRDKIKQFNENGDFDYYKNIKNKNNSKDNLNNNNNIVKNNLNTLNDKNCIKNIDLDKNIITINKQNLKELNNINKEMKIEKKIELFKKGEIINIYINGKLNYNKDITNSIKTSFEYLTNNKFSCTFDNFGQIKSNSKFPNDLIEKFLEKKRNKNKEKNNNNYVTFGNNPLETLKDIQNNLAENYLPQKNSKISIKQFKINQKNLKEQNILLQDYIKSLPVLNCPPDSKIFKLNQYYLFNKINDDKNINILNNAFNKNIKNNNNYNNIRDKEDSEEETIDRHLKKKFINKKRNKNFDIK